MELFNQYCNSEIQFLFDLYALNRPFTKEEFSKLAKKNHVYTWNGSYNELLKKLLSPDNQDEYNTYALIKHSGDKFKTEYPSFALPPNKIEMDFLKTIINSPQGKLFLNSSTREEFKADDNSVFRYIKHQSSHGKKSEVKKLNPDIFKTILKAINTGHSLNIKYRTKGEKELHDSVIVPYRFEYNAFDGRWWLIAYFPAEDRAIKTVLKNIMYAEIGKPFNSDEHKIQAMITDRIVESEIVLHINNQYNVLERCFLVFENMTDMTAYQLSENEYELHFRYFEWDKNLIIRKLLYLGEFVTVKAPDDIIQAMVEELKKSIADL